MAYHAPALRPLGVGDLLDEAIRLYRRNFPLLVAIIAVVAAPVALLQLLYQVLTFAAPGIATILGGSILVSTLSGLAYLAIFLAITHAISEAYLGRRVTLGIAYSVGLQRFGSALGLSLLSFMALALISVTILGIPVAIYLAICWTVALHALLLEGLGIRPALGRSRALVRGRWWRVLGILILLGILQWIIQIVFSLPAIFLSLLMVRESSTLALTLLSAVSTVMGLAAELVGGPIWFTGLVLLYYDLRIRKEGLDLQMQAQRMEAPPPSDTTSG